MQCFNEEEQSKFVVSRIFDLYEQGIELKNIAVLFRAGYHSYALELELKHHGIPYVKWGGLKFLETAHLKDVLAYMRVLYNPHDHVSWMRILTLVKGIGSKTAVIISKYIIENTTLDIENLNISGKLKLKLKPLFSILQQAEENLINLKPWQILEIICDYYFEILKNKYDDYPKRIKDIDQLALISSNFENITEFLTDIALEPSAQIAQSDKTNEYKDFLTLSTVHSAKGLEWEAVFIIWAMEGRFPVTSADDNESIEEERRLMYVAMTRAKRFLTITYPTQMWNPILHTMSKKPSRFLDEIGDTYLEKWKISS